jgi:predicted Zn-dependent protease
MARMNIGLGELKQALIMTDDAIAAAASAPEIAEANLYRGVVLGRQDDLPEAEGAFRAAIAADPTCTACKFNLGFVLLKQSKNAEGIAVLKPLAPEFSAKSSTGENVNLNTLKGKVVLLDFWGT